MYPYLGTRPGFQSKMASKVTKAYLNDAQLGIALIAVISGLTCKRGERVNTALY